MSTNVPVTDWRAPYSNGELGSTSGNIVTLSGNQITTLSGVSLVILGGSFTPVPETIWDATVEPVPITTWQPNDTRDEFSDTSSSNIADPSGNFLVDTIGNQIVDTGVIDTPLATTEWAEDDSV